MFPTRVTIVIISLAAACGVFERILSREELADVQERIDLISRMELIGRTVAAAVTQVEPPAPAFPVVRPYEEIPQAAGWPLAGNAFAMMGDLFGLLLREYRRHGPIFRIQAFNRHFVALVGPEATSFLNKEGQALLRSFEEFSAFREALGCVHMVVGMDGPEHVRLRKALATGYSLKYLQGRYQAIIDIASGTVAGWPQGKAIAPVPAFQAIVAEQLGVLLTGQPPGEYLDPLRYYLMSLVRLFRQGLAVPHLGGRFRQAERQTNELFDRTLEAHRAEDRMSDGNTDFIDEILAIHRNDPTLIPETDLRLQVLGPYWAGLDSAAVVCAFMLHVLLSEPQLLEQMRSEVDSVFEAGPITAASYRSLTVTRRIFDEVQRRYPIIPALVRVVSNSFEFGGYTVPAGTKVLVGCTVAHHIPEVFPEPEKFDIERFGKDRAEHRQPGAYAPFGFGSHRCLGSGFAEAQIVLTLATVLRETELVLVRPQRPLRTRQVSSIQPVFKFRLVGRREHAPPSRVGVRDD